MTMLEKLRAQKAALEGQAEESALTPEQLWLFQELNYRIEVFESCQIFCRSAPRTTESQALGQHYKVVDAYVQHLSIERQYGKAVDDTQQQHRAAALENLNRVIGDYRRRFKSYRPGTAEQYAADIGQALHNVLIAWTQHRQCYVEIKKED
ncbi:MAG: hypothetical protein FWE98_05985 [Oscillospiraceae bacterium]|nr:hypothetical protein [Oscillospiraceae bacterium]